MSAGLRYPRLFTPLRLGPITVGNRIVLAAHRTNYAERGLPGARHTAYYAARARGGTGLIITEEQSTHPTDQAHEKLVRGYDPAVVGRYRAITEAVHAHGVPILAQLNHNGGQGSSMYSRRPLWAPSPVADPVFREVPKAVERHEISEIIDGYGLAAGHCVAGGFDGVELQCAHSSIVRGFLSPATNRRTDRYGGPLPNRARLMRELISELRLAIGPHRVLGVRLCGDELVEGGATIEDAVEVARMVEHSGKVDYINTSIGLATQTRYLVEASMHVPPDYALFVANAMRRAVDLPVIGVGRFKDPAQAERALTEGHCDLVGVVRGQIADPDFAAKARSGAADAIRTCLSCNQECVARVGQNRWMGCVENPRAGRELASAAPPASQTGSPKGHGSRLPLVQRKPVGLPSPRRRAREVLVVGAGPAGLQAAIAAARGGHQVRVYEREPRPGGQVRLAASVPNRAELGHLVRNQLSECRRHGIAISYGTSVDTALVRRERPDAVVVATGARPERPPWARQPGEAATRVVDVRAVLDGGAQPRGTVLVVDELGFHPATSVAERLADRGCAVEIVTPAMVVGQDLDRTLDLETWCVRAAGKGIVETCAHSVTGVVPAADPGRLTVALRHHLTGERMDRTVDWVVYAVPQAPVDELYRRLRGAPFPVFRAGDCVAPRRAHAAVVEGERVGAAL